jgi:5,10-methylene-tetrahydrofolate dehydrogenase/methenyl tetrahydrofolate cyclohydrolase
MTTRVDGKAIAKKIQIHLKRYTDRLEVPINFDIVYVGSDPVIDNFIRYKRKFGEAIGVNVTVHDFPSDISQSELVSSINSLNISSDAIIVQLPLPEHLDMTAITSTVVPLKDVDVLGTRAVDAFKKRNEMFFPPVTGSVIEVLRHHNIVLKNKKIVVIGNGSLVGYPMTLWLDNNEFSYNLLVKETPPTLRNELIMMADVIISGTGSPDLVKGHMVKEGVVLIDAGTSESGKKIIGDIKSDAYDKSSLYTPVPGGIGPITIAILYTNIIKAHKKQNHA